MASDSLQSTSEKQRLGVDFGGGEDADIILLSSDEIEFRAHRLLLSMSSPFFKDLFSLPQNPSMETSNGLPIIRMTEESASDLNLILPLCYPFTETSQAALDDLSVLDRALQLAHKFQMDRIMRQRLGPALLKHSKVDAYRVFALAWAYGVGGNLIRAAARETLLHSTPPVTYHPDFDRMPAGALVKLLAYRRECAIRTSALCKVENLGRWTRSEQISSFLPLTPCPNRCKRNYLVLSGEGLYTYSWWTDYMNRASLSLDSRPHPSTINSTVFLSPSLASAGRCTQCGNQQNLEALCTWSQKIAQEVEKTISEVRVKFLDV
jgi:hypothetical protein